MAEVAVLKTDFGLVPDTTAKASRDDARRLVAHLLPPANLRMSFEEKYRVQTHDPARTDAACIISRTALSL